MTENELQTLSAKAEVEAQSYGEKDHVKTKLGNAVSTPSERDTLQQCGGKTTKNPEERFHSHLLMLKVK